MSMVGKPAPDWTATAYVRGEEKALSSRELLGGWYVLYFYPRDFTFVCPTEIRGFARLEPQFQDDRVSVIGASTDSFFSHKAWLEDRGTFPEPIAHPVIADAGHHLSRAFGVLREEDGAALRATFVVDDRGMVRSMAVNDTQVGRSPAEVLRTVQGFLSGGLCGSDWKKGERFAR
jgi:peroxiredoxin (alkyl hydroperoxide reductase subunit C)